MKKFVVLTLVLGMVSLASAGIVMTTTYDGSDLEASDTFTVDISIDEMMFPLVNETLALIVSDSTVADIYGGTPVAPANPADKILIWDNMSSPGWAEDDGVAMVLSVLGGVYMADTVMFDDIVFECLGGTNIVTVSLVTGVLDASDQYVVGEVLAELQVSQIPEPMTLALLGLGGLFLRRRK